MAVQDQQWWRGIFQGCCYYGEMLFHVRPKNLSLRRLEVMHSHGRSPSRAVLEHLEVGSIVHCRHCHLMIKSSSSLLESKSQCKKIVEIKVAIFFIWGWFFLRFLKLFYEQRYNCLFSVHAICTVHDYLIIVTHTLYLSKKNIVTYFSG